MERKRAEDFEQPLLDLYDDYAHGRIDRRGFLEGAAKFAVGGLTAAALLANLSPNYAWAQQVAPDDARLQCEYVEYPSSEGAGKMRGYLVQPVAVEGRLPAVLVIHENRGLNPYIEDVARRLGTAGFLALAPDALTPLGGYPGDDDRGRELQARRDAEQMIQDFIAGAQWLKNHPRSSGKVGVVGFCYGGGVANTLAVRIPDVIAAAVPFYGRREIPRNLTCISINSDVQGKPSKPRQPLSENNRTPAQSNDDSAQPLPSVRHLYHPDHRKLPAALVPRLAGKRLLLTGRTPPAWQIAFQAARKHSQQPTSPLVPSREPASPMRRLGKPFRMVPRPQWLRSSPRYGAPEYSRSADPLPSAGRGTDG